MNARDELLASLTAERYAIRPRPVDTLARVETVGRVDWGAAFAERCDQPSPDEPCEVCGLPVSADYIAQTGRARHGHHPDDTPPQDSERDRLRRLMPGRTPKEPRQ